MEAYEQYMRELAAAMGAPWKLLSVETNYEVTKARIGLSSGPTITCRAGLRDGRLEVIANWPQGYAPWDQVKTITVAVSRGAQAAALDIGRRFLPWYLGVYAQRVERQSEDERKRQARHEAATLVQMALGDGAKFHDPSRNSSVDSILEVWRDDVNVKITEADSIVLVIEHLDARRAAMILRGLVQAGVGIKTEDGA